MVFFCLYVPLFGGRRNIRSNPLKLTKREYGQVLQYRKRIYEKDTNGKPQVTDKCKEQDPHIAKYISRKASHANFKSSRPL